jgi:hypothetical protein
MKRFYTICAALLFAAVATAQDQVEPAKSAGTWATSSTPALKATEFFFNNWSKSGNSQIDVTATFFGNYKYTHPKFVWDNVVDLAYGFAWQDLDNTDTVGGLFETRRKSNDKIDLTSAISWNAYKGWGASFTANLKTQFGAGYEYDGIGAAAEATKRQVSGFFAPAYLTTALSFEYKKTDWSVSLSFLTGKTTFVCSDSLIANGYTYGVIQPDDFDATDPTTFNHAYFALGSYVKAQYLKKDLLPRLDLYARAELFYDYWKPTNMAWDNMVDPATGDILSKYALAEGETYDDLAAYGWLKRRAFETDLDIELKLDYRFSEHIAANFALNMKWDTDFSGMGSWGHWQIYQMAGVQVFFNWKSPKQ